MTTLSQFIRRSSWGLTVAPVDLQIAETTAVERHVEAGESVYRQGDSPTHWIGVIEGELRVITMSKIGKTTAISSVTPEDWVGEAPLLSWSSRGFALVATRGSRIACIPKETFSRLCENSVPFNHFLVHKMAQRMGRLATMLAVDRLSDATARTAYCLVDLAAADAGMTSDGWLRISQEDIALLVGLSRQHANRAIAALAHDGLVKLGNRRIAINDLEALKRVCAL